MPTLSAMFRLMDGYSSQVNKMMNKTDQAMTKMLGASKAADKVNDSTVKAGKGFERAAGQNKKFNSSLDDTSTKATRANSGLKKLIGTVASLAAAKKGMDITDSYTNSSARLKMINDGSQTPAELQGKVFAASNRSRGSYTDMASAVSKMNLLAGDSFKTNDEAIGFTELLQKSLKVSGASKSEQNSAFLQLTQAMAAGKLQGDEFRSVMENAPMVADAIAKYMGKSKGELKEMSSQGLITADIIKNAMFMAGNNINDKFSEMPMTFADTWDKIKNAGLQAFGGVFLKINEVMNSPGVQQGLNNLIGLIFLAGGAMENFIDFCMTAWPMVSPLIWAAVLAVGAYVLITKGVAITGAIVAGASAAWGILSMAVGILTGNTAALSAAQFMYNGTLLACPITWIIGAVILMIAIFYAAVAAVNHFAGASLSATGLVVGSLFTAGAFIANLFIGLWNFLVGIAVDLTNVFISFGEFFANFLNNPVLAIVNLVADLANFVLGVMQSLATAIDSVFGSNLAGAVGGWVSSVEEFKTGIAQENTITFDRIDKTQLQFDRLNYSSSFDKGYGTGSGFADKASGLLSGFKPDLSGIPKGGGAGLGFEPFGGLGSAGSPATVKGTGAGGAVKVENEDDVEWMRKLAERDYIARISTNTLAPNIKVEFSGPITKEADTDGVAAHLGKLLKEQIAKAPEGVYV